jgi:hypothetical protein
MILYGKINMNSLDILLPSQFKINELLMEASQLHAKVPEIHCETQGL